MNIPTLVRERYKIWSRFLTEQVGFSLQHSQQHTKEHCARVLLFCLLFAQRENLSEQDADALAMAACFHDSRRINDGLDIGHGHRAAKYYCTWCAEHEYVLDARVVFIMAYHEQNDKLGKAALQRKFPDDPNAVLLYQLFKDADALDRFRLGPEGLDVNYLRTSYAKELVEFSQTLLRIGPERVLSES